MKVIMISSYPTEGCGISKYTEQLIKQLKNNQVSLTSRRVFFYKEKLKLFPWLNFFQEILSINPDVVHIQYTPTICGYFLPFFLILLWICGVKTIVTSHEKPSTYLKYFNVVTAPFFILYEKCIYSLPDRILVHSYEHKNELINKYKLREKKIKIIPYGISNPQEVDNSQIEQLKKKYKLGNKDIITFFGFIRPNKGIEYLISSFSKVLKKCCLILIIAGSVPEIWLGYLEKLKHLIKRLRIEEYVRFTGFINENEVGSIFAISKIIVLPYIQITQSGVLYQAISFTRPIIVSDVSGISEIVKKNNLGLVVPPKDVIALKNAILEILKNSKKFNKYIKNQERVRKLYSWNNVAHLHKKIYKATKKG